MTTIAKFTEANRQLAAAKTVDEVKKVIATADMMMRAAKEMKEERAQTEADARELRLRAERRLGEMMKATPPAPNAGQQRAQGTLGNQYKSSDKGFQKTHISQVEAGIDKNLANRARKAVALNEQEFEEMILDVREGGGKKKHNRNTPRDPEMTEAKKEAIGQFVLDGKTQKEAVAAFGLSSVQPVKLAVEYELGRRNAPIDPETLPKSAQEKLQRAIKQAVRKLEAEYDGRIRDGIKQAIEETVLPHYNKKMEEYEEVIKARKGVMTTDEYRLILSCLHPDQSASPDRLRKAFEIFKSRELSLRGEKEMPTAPSSLPRTYAEMMQRREEVRAARRHKRQQSNGMVAR